MDDKAASGRFVDDSRELMARARRGSRRAFDEVAARYANMTIALAFKMLNSREDALDCAQDAFVRAWENVDRYDPRWSVATWLRRIVTNLALDRLRRRKVRGGFSDVVEANLTHAAEGPAESAARKERAEVVQELLQLLPDKYRLVLVLRDMQDAAISEIAEITGANPATVRWRLHRARALFRQQWFKATVGE